MINRTQVIKCVNILIKDNSIYPILNLFYYVGGRILPRSEPILLRWWTYSTTFRTYCNTLVDIFYYVPNLFYYVGGRILLRSEPHLIRWWTYFITFRTYFNTLVDVFYHVPNLF